jgi:hypothetical protein
MFELRQILRGRSIFELHVQALVHVTYQDTNRDINRDINRDADRDTDHNTNHDDTNICIITPVTFWAN